ncbi:MAG TPA: hypothetical protein VHC68_02335 [Candidatus Paceibacterota bacterium]|nr:hypothetical protein [Candidatus Paceibacterota bacterium]
MITLSWAQLIVLLMLSAMIVPIFGGFVHHETNNPKSHGRAAYGMAFVVLLGIGASVVHGIDLPRMAWHSFDHAERAPRGDAGPGSSSWTDSLWRSRHRRHL